MSNAIFTIEPGFLTDPSKPLSIKFTLPVRADNVKVTVLELDSWAFGDQGFTESGLPEAVPIAEFTGSIRKRRFRVEDFTKLQAGTIGGGGQAGTRGQTKPVVKVKFHDSVTVYDIPVDHADHRLGGEGGELEIWLKVEGPTITGGSGWDSSSRWDASSRPFPVFVRNYGVANPQLRPVIAFYMGSPSVKGLKVGSKRWKSRVFFKYGIGYWTSRVDAPPIRGFSLQGILGYLCSSSNRMILSKYGSGKWGEVNIVSHGSEGQWNVKLFNPKSKPKGCPGYIDTKTITKYGSNPLLSPKDKKNEDLLSKVLDEQSRIVLRGCNMGDSQTLLNNIRSLFGGKAEVYAPRHLQQYYKWTFGKMTKYIEAMAKRTNEGDQTIKVGQDIWVPSIYNPHDYGRSPDWTTADWKWAEEDGDIDGI